MGAGVVSGAWRLPLEYPGSEYAGAEVLGVELPEVPVVPDVGELAGWCTTAGVVAAAWFTLRASQTVMNPVSTAAAPAIHLVAVLT